MRPRLGGRARLRRAPDLCPAGVLRKRHPFFSDIGALTQLVTRSAFGICGRARERSKWALSRHTANVCNGSKTDIRTLRTRTARSTFGPPEAHRELEASDGYLSAQGERSALAPKKTSFSPTLFKLGHIFEQIPAICPRERQIMRLLHS